MAKEKLLDDLRSYVGDIVEQHRIPALSVAISRDNKMYRAACGILNSETRVEATVDSVFQIGSISKAFTASLVMLLVDEGKLELDKPVKCYLPSFHVADPEATETLTLRHLLSHTSGLVSDFSISHDDTYEEGNAIARFVDRCFLLPQVHSQIGKRFSYSNSAYVIAGRIVEVVAGVPFRKVLEDRIFKPLNMVHSLISPLEVIRFRAAMGHFLSGTAANRTVAIAPRGFYLLGRAPSGTVLMMSASDLIRFANAHLREGRTESGAQWMSEKSVRAMQEVQVALPGPCSLLENSWGVGWHLTDCNGVKGFGHRGGTIGQEAVLQIVPECDLALSVQVNGVPFGGSPVLRQVLLDVLHEVAGVRPQSQVRSSESADLARFTGEFGGTGFRFAITQREGQLFGKVQVEFSSAYPSPTLSLEPIGKDRFASYTQDGEPAEYFTFLEPDHLGVPKYLFWGHRLHGRLCA